MAASFYSSPLIGATTTLACFAHEIPHEIADYSILIRSGFTKKQAMQSQFLTAIGAFVRAFPPSSSLPPSLPSFIPLIYAVCMRIEAAADGRTLTCIFLTLYYGRVCHVMSRRTQVGYGELSRYRRADR